MRKYLPLIALLALFVACKPEQKPEPQPEQKPEEKPEPIPEGARGVLSIDVLRPGGDPLTGEFRITGYESLPESKIAYSGNRATVSFQAAEGVSLPATELTLSVTGDILLFPGTDKISVPAIAAGENRDLSFQVHVGEDIRNWQFEEKKTVGERTLTGRRILDNRNYPSYDFELEGASVLSWYVNNTAYRLSGTVAITFREGYSEGYDTETHDYAGFESIPLPKDGSTTVEAWLDAHKESTEMETTLNYSFHVSAWAMWNVIIQLYVEPETQSLLAVRLDGNGNPTDEKVVLASVTRNQFECSYGIEELPYPLADGEYVWDGGLEGGAGNAGGEMVDFN